MAKEYTSYTPAKTVIIGLRKGSAFYKAKQRMRINNDNSDLDTLSPQDTDKKDNEVTSKSSKDKTGEP